MYKIVRLRNDEGEDVSSNRNHNTERNKNDPGKRKGTVRTSKPTITIDDTCIHDEGK